MSRLERLSAWWSHAFATDPGRQPLDPAEAALVDRLATIVVRRGMSVPAAMALECARPLSFLGSQLLHLAAPFATLAFDAAEYERLARLMERREAVDLLLTALAARQEDGGAGAVAPTRGGGSVGDDAAGPSGRPAPARSCDGPADE